MGRLDQRKFEAPRGPQVPDLKCPCQNFTFGRRILWTGLNFDVVWDVFCFQLLVVSKNHIYLLTRILILWTTKHPDLRKTNSRLWFQPIVTVGLCFGFGILCNGFSIMHTQIPTQFRTNNQNQQLTCMLFGVFLSTYPWLPKGCFMKITVVSFTWMAGAKGKSGRQKSLQLSKTQRLWLILSLTPSRSHLQKSGTGLLGLWMDTLMSTAHLQALRLQPQPQSVQPPRAKQCHLQVRWVQLQKRKRSPRSGKRSLPKKRAVQTIRRQRMRRQRIQRMGRQKVQWTKPRMERKRMQRTQGPVCFWKKGRIINRSVRSTSQRLATSCAVRCTGNRLQRVTMLLLLLKLPAKSVIGRDYEEPMVTENDTLPSSSPLGLASVAAWSAELSRKKKLSWKLLLQVNPITAGTWR